MAEETFVIKAKDATKAAFDSVERGIGKLGVSLDKLGISAGALSATMGLSVAAGMAAVVKRQIDVADSSIKSARALGLNVEAYSALSYQASLSMDDVGKLDIALRTLTKGLGQAAAGTGPARDAIKDLGLNAQTLANMAPERAIEEIAEALDKQTNANDKARIGNALFGESWAQMSLLMAGGKEAMRAARLEAEKYGKVIKTDTAQAAEQFNDNITRLQANLSGMAMKITAEVLPALVRLTDAMTGQENLDSLMRKRAQLAIRFAQVQSRIIEGTIGGGFRDELEIIKKEIDDTDNRIIAMNKRAQAADKAAGRATGVSAGGRTVKGGKKEDDPAEKFRQDALRKYDAMNDGLMTENERLEADYQAKLIALDNFYMTSEMTEDGYRLRKEQLEQQHQAKLKDITDRGKSAQQKLWESGMNGRLEVTSQVLGNLSTLMQSENKKQFEIGKKAAIAQAVVDTYLAAQKSFTALAGIPIVGPGLGAAAAAIAVAAGMVRVNAIKSQQFGGSGSAAAGGGAMPTYSANPNTGQPDQPIGLPGGEQDRSQKTMQVYIQGNILSQQFVADEVAPILKDLIDNNDVTIMSSGSRQAQELVA